MIARADFDLYCRAVDALADEAASAAESQVLAWCSANQGASTASARQAAIEILEAVTASYDSTAASLAAQWYDETVVSANPKLKSAITSVTRSYESISKTARYQAGKYADGDVDGFASACGEYAANSAKQSLNGTVLANAARDSGADVRFARVATGRETCAFCLMLSSRGAVYHTRHTAGEMNHYHRNCDCDCKIVAGTASDKDAEIVEGYDPAGMRARMRLIEEQTGYSFSDKEQLSLIDEYLRLHASEWAVFGTTKAVDYSLCDRSEYGTVTVAGDYSAESVTGKGAEWRDLFAHDVLEANGFDVAIRPKNATGSDGKELKGVTNPDITISGQLWEIKSPDAAKATSGTLDYIGDQLKRARKNFGNPYDPATKAAMEGYDGTKRVVLNLFYRPAQASAEKVAEVIAEEMRARHISELIYIDGDGKVRYFA